MSGKVKNHKFREDIQRYVNSKIRDVKCVDEIISNVSTSVSEYTVIDDIDSSYRELYRFKLILQILINAFNNHEYYKNCVVELTVGVKDNLKSLPPCCDHDAASGLWRCNTRPSESDVVEALFNYALCFLSILHKENFIENGDNSEELPDVCGYCDEAISKETKRCSVCNTSVNDMRGLKRTRCTKPKTETGIKESVNQCSDERGTENGVKNEQKTIDKPRNKEIVRTRNTDVQNGVQSSCSGVDKKYFEKWKCGRCGCCNEYSMLNCEACADVFKEGTWGCGGCGAVGISCKDDCCNTCGRRNGNMTNGVKEDKTELKRDQWSCAHCTARNDDKVKICTCCAKSKDGVEGGKVIGSDIGKDQLLRGERYQWSCVYCTTRNDDKVRICTCCSKSKDVIGGDIENLEKNQWVCGKCGLFESYDRTVCHVCDARRVDDGSWKCGECTLKNKCSSAVCGACGACNDYLRVGENRAPRGAVADDNNKKNQPQKNTKKGGRPEAGRWLCRNSNCKNTNDMTIDYCKTCNIHRDYSGARGEEAHKMTKNGVLKWWICESCHKFNELTDKICAKAVCRKSRYGEIKPTSV